MPRIGFADRAPSSHVTAQHAQALNTTHETSPLSARLAHEVDSLHLLPQPVVVLSTSRARGGWSPALVGTGPNIALVKALVNYFCQNAARSDSLDYISEIRTDYF